MRGGRDSRGEGTALIFTVAVGTRPTQVLNSHGTKHTHTHEGTSDGGDLKVRDRTNIDILIVMAHCSCARYYNRGKLGKGYMESL